MKRRVGAATGPDSDRRMAFWSTQWQSRWTAEQAHAYENAGMWGSLGMTGMLAAHADRFPDGVAFDDGRERITFSQLHRQSGSVGAALRRHGIVAGDVVVVRAATSIRHIVAVFALDAIGAVLYEVATDYGAQATVAAIERSGAAALVTDAAPTTEERRALGGAALVVGLGAFEAQEVLPFEELLAHGPADHPDLGSNWVNLLIGTSGTTGTPKIVMRTTNSSVSMARSVLARTRVLPDEVLMAAAPMSGGVGFINSICAGMAVGCTVVLPHSLEAGHLLRLVESRRVAVIATLPTVLARLVNSPDREGRDLSSLRCVQAGGSYVTRESARAVEQGLGCALAIVYGSMDVGVATMTDPQDDPLDRRYGTVGRPLPAVAFRLLDPQGRPVAPGESGEVVLRGPSLAVGYFNDDAATASVFDTQGWGRLGDIATQDAEGYVRIVGRIKDIIIRGGRNISANSVEEAVSGHPAVREVAAVGYPDAELGERCAVFVVLRSGQALTLPDLQQYLQTNGVPKYLWPERLQVVDALALSTQGKVLKRKLQEQLLAA